MFSTSADEMDDGDYVQLQAEDTDDLDMAFEQDDGKKHVLISNHMTAYSVH